MTAEERTRTASSRRYVLGGGPGTAGAFRDLCARAVADWYGPLTPAARTAADDVLLLVTELVAHAVRRGGVPYELRLDRSVDGVWIQVTDTAPAGPRPASRHHPDRVPGPGLHLVQRLAAAWGRVPRERGVTVWCEVAFPPPHRAAAAPDTASRPSETAGPG
ncbi:ATP-binding protein [Streptomyces griseus]|uniref:ATP-binding protein n=1 Tax=Streptomyces griseus TaxID=1911 RepID=UPI00068B15A8|nr:ATP-binding protein [Streptomyces griseus]